MSSTFLVCPKCGEELEVRTTTVTIPKDLEEEVEEYIEEEDNKMLTEWSSRWQ